MRGDMTQMMDSFARLLRGLELAVLFIFLILVAQFRGLLAPLQMVLSIPLELAGVFFGLWAAHQAFSSVSIMAVIVLTGMDITTAILLLDQIQRRRAEGNLPRDAAIALACHDRLRPILMTSLITIITMLPVALRPKTGMDAYQPLGTVIVAGLLVGTLLSLLVIPVMHALVDDLGQLFSRRRRAALHPVVPILLLLTFLTPLSAQTLTLSRADALTLAARQNPANKAARADADAAEADAKAARAGEKPALSATTLATTGDSNNIFPSAPNVMPGNLFGLPPGRYADGNLMLMVPITTGGRLQSRTNAARNLADAMGLTATATTQTTARDAALAYDAALLQNALVNAASARLDAELEQIRVTGERVKTGRSATLDLRREQVEEADARQSLLAAQNDAALALVNLKTVLNLSQTEEIMLTDTLETLASKSETLPETLADAQKRAAANRPELAAWARQTDAARAGIRQAQSAFAPQVYGVAMGDATTTSRDGNRSGYTVGVTVSLPILDGGQRRADVQSASAKLARAEADSETVRAAVARETATAWLALQTAKAQRDAADAGLTAATEGYALAVQRYDAGKSLAVERLDSLAALTRARAAVARTLAALLDARAALQKAVGR